MISCRLLFFIMIYLVKEKLLFGFSFFLFHFYFLYLSEQVGCKYKVVKLLICGRDDLVLVALPFLVTFIDETNILANAHDGVHVVRIDDGRHVVVLGDT